MHGRQMDRRYRKRLTIEGSEERLSGAGYGSLLEASKGEDALVGRQLQGELDRPCLAAA